MSMTSNYAFPVGAKVKVAARYRDSTTLPANITYVVESCRSAGLQDDAGFQVRLEGLTPEFPTAMFVWAESPKRESIKFTLTKQTSRDYAALQISKVLDAKTNDTLKAAANSEEIDAIDFRDALTQAHSAAATRDAHSGTRRERTSQIRHLTYIVNAVLDNAFYGLPPVDAGTRSPKIDALERDLDAARQALKYVEDLNTELRQEKATLRERVADLCERRAKDGDLFTTLTNDKVAAECKVGDLVETLDYAKELLGTLSDVALGQVYGFEDAIEAGNR